MTNRRIVLVSKSPRRKELLEKMELSFECTCSVGIDETNEIYPPFAAAVERLSRLKAESVMGLYPDSILIAADTVVICNNINLGKPEDNESAFKTLSKLRNNVHEVITGVTITDTGNNKIESFHEITEVEFGNFDDEEISWYILSGEPFDKAGAYGIQGKAAQFVKRINGCYYNVMGLPVYALYQALKRFDVLLPYRRVVRP
jgi:septum formation protein